MAELDDGLSWSEFSMLLTGLSDRSRWRQAAADTPVIVDADEARSMIANL